MRFEIRRHKDRQLLGSAYLEEGRVVLEGALRSLQGRVLTAEDGVTTLTQADGEPWLHAVSRMFRTPYVVSELIAE